MMRLGRIMMHCPWCKKQVEVDREKTDPPAAVALHLQCDTCDDGDFHEPVFYDAAGEWVHPVEHLA